MSKNVTFTHESAEAYAAMELTGFYLHAARHVRAKLRASGEPIQTLVDFGCGAGRSTRAVAELIAPGGKAIGVDVSSEMIAQAERLTVLTQSQFPHVRFEYCTIRDGVIPVADAVADVVTTSAVLQEIQSEEELAKVCNELSRITRSGGQLVAIVMNEHIRAEEFVSLTYKPYPENLTRQDNIRKCRSCEAPIVWESDRHWSRETYARLLESAGFTMISLEYPLADPTQPPYPDHPEVPWKDELKVAPALLIHARRAPRAP
jgi:ubiquinone/menaquinone biosynthesis C-methylase UbiE